MFHRLLYSLKKYIYIYIYIYNIYIHYVIFSMLYIGEKWIKKQLNWFVRNLTHHLKEKEQLLAITFHNINITVIHYILMETYPLKTRITNTSITYMYPIVIYRLLISLTMNHRYHIYLPLSKSIPNRTNYTNVLNPKLS